jgi:ABC-2 type transport system ATP-binding protein
MTAIQTENLQKFYGQVHALDGLSLQVEAGSVFGFLGPNGAGKSTTIRLLTGLARPSGGQAWVAGVEVGSSQQVASRIGYLPEEPAFYNWMTPEEFLDHVGRLFRIKAAERKTRTRELLEQVGLSEVRKRRIGGFSRGMRQRLGLAQAMYNHPEVLFLDEPVSALDPAGRKEVLDLIRQLRQQSTVFMSTHILADVERVCDTVGIINRGKLVVEARQEELLSRYTIPAFELECDPGLEETFKAWCDTVRTEAWATSVVVNGSTARVIVKDVAQARQALLARVVDAGLALRRYEIVTPSLEDIFLRLVNGESKPI